MNKMNTANICPLCLTNAVNIYLNPCGHTCCDSCYDKLEAKFNEIVDGNHEGGFLNNAIAMARKLEMNSFGRIFGP